jgi:hypothetical protein
MKENIRVSKHKSILVPINSSNFYEARSISIYLLLVIPQKLLECCKLYRLTLTGAGGFFAKEKYAKNMKEQ